MQAQPGKQAVEAGADPGEVGVAGPIFAAGDTLEPGQAFEAMQAMAEGGGPAQAARGGSDGEAGAVRCDALLQALQFLVDQLGQARQFIVTLAVEGFGDQRRAVGVAGGQALAFDQQPGVGAGRVVGIAGEVGPRPQSAAARIEVGGLLGVPAIGDADVADGVGQQRQQVELIGAEFGQRDRHHLVQHAVGAGDEGVDPTAFAPGRPWTVAGHVG